MVFLELWTALGQAARNNIMESLDRLQILDDMIALNMAGSIILRKVKNKILQKLCKMSKERIEFRRYLNIKVSFV